MKIVLLYIKFSRMKGTILGIILFVFLSAGYSQISNKIKDTDIFAGGSFGIQFGNVTNIEASPHIGLYLTKNLSVSLGGVYQYFHDNRSIPDVKLQISGGRAFVRYDFLNNFFVHAEYEMLTYKTDIFSQVRDMERIISENILLGAGYRQFFNENSSSNAYIMIMYNANETIYTPYSNPVLRFGLEFHLFNSSK